jgi:hypothetical protein
LTSPSPNGHTSQSLAVWAAEAAAATEIARQMVPTEFVPATLRVWTDDAKDVLDFPATVQTVAMVLLAGQELGFGPMASLRSITIIRGTVGLYALAARALLLQNGHEIEVRELTSTRAIVDGRRAGAAQWQRSTWDIPRATLAKLYPGKMDGNWRTQTKSMLVARATAETCRWVAADALLGLPLMVEEIEDGTAEEVRAIGSAATAPGPEPAEPAEPKRTAKRKRTPAGARLPDGPRPGPDPVPPMAAPDPAPPVPPERLLNRAQRRRIIEGVAAIGKAGTAEEALEFVNAAIEDTSGRVVESTGDLTAAEAETVLAAITVLRNLAAEQGPDEAGAAAADQAGEDAEAGQDEALPGMPDPPAAGPEGERDPG